jgi:hypothetical protein
MPCATFDLLTPRPDLAMGFLGGPLSRLREEAGSSADPHRLIRKAGPNPKRHCHAEAVNCDVVEGAAVAAGGWRPVG